MDSLSQAEVLSVTSSELGPGTNCGTSSSGLDATSSDNLLI